eukprot:TRINITY_DN8139_c0_g1_i7.p1 TRINITY_DN8139_c0_g1~~TRINITY_DN8139_c0_g1_i7.p1  ORF type:complete len:433 (-),score=75.34 TRINITY_DN8139_c0_g1_i7:256-1554(-)
MLIIITDSLSIVSLDILTSSTTEHSNLPFLLSNYRFIEGVILCKICELPETSLKDIKEDSNSNIERRCWSCGATDLLPEAETLLLNACFKIHREHKHNFTDKSFDDILKSKRKNSQNFIQLRTKDLREEARALALKISEMAQDEALKGDSPRLINRVSELLNGAKSENLTKRGSWKMYVFFNGVISKNNLRNEIIKKTKLLKCFVEVNNIQLSESILLASFESFLGENFKREEYEPYVATLMKTLVDNELLSQEFLGAWDEGNMDLVLSEIDFFEPDLDKTIKKAAAPFLKWLREQDDEEEEDEIDEGSEETKAEEAGEEENEEDKTEIEAEKKSLSEGSQSLQISFDDMPSDELTNSYLVDRISNQEASFNIVKDRELKGCCLWIESWLMLWLSEDKNINHQALKNSSPKTTAFRKPLFFSVHLQYLISQS